MQALEQAVSILATAGIPEVRWRDHDDRCDCTFQRVCQWTNSYMGTTHEERLCCIWAKLHEMFPGCSRDIPAWFDINAQEWVAEPQEWNGEFDMPPAVWHRQLARKYGIGVSEAREMNLPAPKGQPRQPKPVFLLKWGSDWIEMELG